MFLKFRTLENNYFSAVHNFRNNVSEKMLVDPLSLLSRPAIKVCSSLDPEDGPMIRCKQASQEL